MLAQGFALSVMLVVAMATSIDICSMACREVYQLTYQCTAACSPNGAYDARASRECTNPCYSISQPCRKSCQRTFSSCAGVCDFEDTDCFVACLRGRIDWNPPPYVL